MICRSSALHLEQDSKIIMTSLLLFQESATQRRAGDSYLSTVSDTLLTREAGLNKSAVGGVLGRQQYTGMELAGFNETEVCGTHCVVCTLS